MNIKKYGWNYFGKLMNKEEYNKGIFKHTKRISIELSNLCNYSILHKSCPLHYVKEPKILPEKIFNHVIETCKKYDFKGIIAFHTYNEPGIDPRLMMFIKRTKKILSESTIFLLTNGFYFDQILAEEYEKNGVDIILVTAYFPEEKKRINKIKIKIPFSVQKGLLDSRLDMYSIKEINSKKRCYAPLKEIIITNEGKISLCCIEWKREYIFGDLNNQTLEDVINSKEIQNIYDTLSKGQRTLDICKRCRYTR